MACLLTPVRSRALEIFWHSNPSPVGMHLESRVWSCSDAESPVSTRREDVLYAFMAKSVKVIAAYSAWRQRKVAEGSLLLLVVVGSYFGIFQLVLYVLLGSSNWLFLLTMAVLNGLAFALIYRWAYRKKGQWGSIR